MLVFKTISDKFFICEKFIVGCQAVGGKPVIKIAEEMKMSCENVCQQKAKVKQYAEKMDITESETLILILDQRNIKRIILSLSLDSQSRRPFSCRYRS